jgi:hypothetical protein
MNKNYMCVVAYVENNSVNYHYQLAYMYRGIAYWYMCIV